MKGQLENAFSWSASRSKAFDKCRRLYWHTYYGSWGGWLQSSPPAVRQAYLLKKLDNRFSWRGRIAHDAIAEWRASARSPKQLIERAQQQMRADYKLSRVRVGKPPAKLRDDFFGLLEHELGEDLADDVWVGIWTQTKAMLEWFFASEWPERIRTIPHDQVLALDEKDFMGSQFVFEGTRIFAMPDFAYLDDAGRCQTLDFKSGRPSEADRPQLVGYAKFLEEKFGVPRDATSINLVYLGRGTVDFPVTSADVDGWEQSTRSSISAMRQLLVDERKNVPRPIEAFPMTADRDECARCAFRKVCAAARGDA